MLEVGQGAARDTDECLRLYHAAAEHGHRSAQYDLAYMYHHGLNIRQDFQQASRLYQRAAAQGLPLANNNLAFM